MNTEFPLDLVNRSCSGCRDGVVPDIEFIMAFQPILDLRTMRPFAYEALVRGVDGGGAQTVLGKVNDQNRYRFDQACRVKAIEQAAALGLQHLPDCFLSINFFPNAVYRPETCIQSTLNACQISGFPVGRLMFEVTESEPVENPQHLSNIFAEYRRQGFMTAIDDFGSGYAGLNLLSQFQPDCLKIDIQLVRDIHQDKVKQSIVQGVVGVASSLGLRVIGEGVEAAAERDALLDMGIVLQQGFFYARPAIDQLPLASA